MNKRKIVLFILMVALLLLALPVARGGITVVAQVVKPDLVILDKWEEETKPGYYQVYFVISNEGNAEAPAGLWVVLYVDGSGVESAPTPSPLKPGEAATYVSMEVKCTGTSDTIMACVDVGDYVDELNEYNNCMTNTYYCPEEDLPDLVAVEKWEEETKPGYYRVHFTISNEGNAEAPAGFYIELYIDGSIVASAARPWPLSPGETDTYVYPEVKCTGTSDTIMACIDVDDDVDELDETNNCLENVYTCPEEEEIPPEIEEMCEEQGGEIIAWDVCNNGEGYSLPGPEVEDPDPHCEKPDCCGVYQTTHVHDLEQVIPLADLILRYASGLHHGCEDYLTVEVSPDDLNWTLVKKIATTTTAGSGNGGWEIYTVKLHDVENFQYVRMTIPDCYIYYSAAYACVPPPEEIPWEAAFEDMCEMCEEQGGEIIAWDGCNYHEGYSVPGPVGVSPHCKKADCCAWYQTTHVHDLEQIIPLADLILRYASGFTQGCEDYLTVEVSPDDVNWTWMKKIATTSESVNGGWEIYTVKLHDVENFRYVRMTIPNCFIDYSAAYACVFEGGCFIATAAYGTPMVEEIEILRGFRDEYLLTNRVGQALAALYYRVSPPIAEFITEHPSLKPIVRAGLLPAVAIATVAVNTTVAEKIAIVGLLVLVPIALVVWVARRLGKGSEYS